MTTNPDHSKSSWDISIIIALLAVLISSVSAYISLKESRIMLNQQTILAEQQEASVWPYLANRISMNYKEDTAVTITYTVVNKGVGPAIIDTVNYLYNGEGIKGWALGEKLQKDFPHLKVKQNMNAMLDGVVLAPGENHKVISGTISKSKGDTTVLSILVNSIDYELHYCYCSVYGKCWYVGEDREISPSTDCKFRENIR